MTVLPRSASRDPAMGTEGAEAASILPPEKCRWFNGAKAAAVLMIDDLSNGYLNHYGKGWDARCDWGAGCRRKGSIFSHFEGLLLSRFPEIRYTVFLPFAKHSIGMVPGGYDRQCEDIGKNPEFIDLLLHIQAGGNELAYHGHHHGLSKPTLDPSTWSGEFRDHTLEGYRELIRADIGLAASRFGIKIRGGKFPGYRYNPDLQTMVEQLGFDWWSFDYEPMVWFQRYRGKVLDMPANITGGLFNRSGRAWRDAASGLMREMRLHGRIEKGGLISIQEHFLSTRPDGKRQTPNIFDDMGSLERIFGILRGHDVWFAHCSDLAEYMRSFDSATIAKEARGFRIAAPEGASISVRAGSRNLLAKATGKVLPGAFKGGSWIYNGLGAGQYEYA